METVPEPPIFRSLFEAFPQPCLAVSHRSPEFPIIAVNDAFLRLINCERDQIVGRSVLEIAPFAGVVSQVSNSILAGNRQPTFEGFLSGEGPRQMEHFNLKRDPTFGRTWQCTRRTINADAGKSALLLIEISVLACNPDTDDEEPSREFLREAFQYAVPGLATLDLNGIIQECNSAFAHIVDRKVEELKYTDSSLLIHPEDLERSSEDVRRLLSGESPAFVIEKRYVRPSGEAVWVRNSVTLLRDVHGNPLQIVTISEDITFSRMAEHALLRSEKLAVVGRLSASIMHELNNPLESVTNLLYLISRAETLNESRRFSNLAEQEMKRVSEIATHTLRFYRQQAEPVPLELTDVIDSVFALFEGRLRNTSVRVMKRYVDGTHQLVAYSGELRQVFVNLIGNALDAMGGEGFLFINVHPSGSWKFPGVPGVRITICDTGSGIPKNMMQKIFEPFVTTKADRGTGLGLWISKEIIRRHGGTLSVRSSTVGGHRGTAMSVFLPSSTGPIRVGRAA